ncbi:zinc finger protein with KRAB and SCAN domains 3 [Scaptodrosophila lebanonensis]|uniref:Zinc finger protein with KRAB and SCAN domains 3 n=1 Tax=Drosophila lebanonensis TaxID=7225 RepID=A0A6J2TGF9_DROLE|nr:zinc finger protein with KRAB and SCAN domains 3 [Scaptodrosophila lebanonensis]
MKDIATTQTVATSVTQKWIVCRVCLQQPKETMAVIFHDDASKDLTNMILECGGVPIKKFDHYPDKICDKCLKSLHIAFKFRRNCQRSYKHLSQFIAPVVVEQHIVEDEGVEELQAKSLAELEAQELPDEIEHEILVDLEKELIVHVKSEEGDGEETGVTEELYGVYESYENEGEEEVVIEQMQVYDENDMTELSGLSGDIEYLDQVDQDQLTESAHEDELESKDDKKESYSDEEFIPVSARASNKRGLTTRAAAAKHRKNAAAKAKSAQTGKIKRTTVSTNVILNPDESITIGDTIVRKMPGIKTRGGRKIFVGNSSDKKEYKYICDICGNMYPSQSRLTEHIKVHSGVKPHECEICGHAFAQAQQLARHMNTHTGNRPYKCNYCPAAFADLSTRNKHHRIHTNERPYECDVCHKTFTYTNTLKFHKMIHTGEKPHVCDICGKGFPQAYKLRNHRITHERRGVREALDNSYIHCEMISSPMETMKMEIDKVEGMF